MNPADFTFILYKDEPKDIEVIAWENANPADSQAVTFHVHRSKPVYTADEAIEELVHSMDSWPESVGYKEGGL